MKNEWTFILLPPSLILPPMLHIVLYQPEIPHNTGAAGRLCLATGSRLHLIKPLGFSLEDKYLRRAGLDYWQDVDVHVWDDFAALQASAGDAARFMLFTTKAKQGLWDADLSYGDVYLMFGPESRGLPESLLPQHKTLRIPMRADSTRSLNLAVSIGIAAYEALRQRGHRGLVL
jgi:tRNA (cytidine/uridine-2'-O-)-methyltransferase